MRLVTNGIDKHLAIVEDALTTIGISSDFIITDNLTKHIYYRFLCDKDLLPIGTKKREYLVNRQLSYIRQSLLRIKYKWNGKSAKGIKEGYVYVITHPKLEGVKIGSAIDVDKRLSQYNVCCPRKEFKLYTYIFSMDRAELETVIHTKLQEDRLEGEWFAVCPKDAKELLLKH